MPFELSFAEDFFCSEGYDDLCDHPPKSDRPTSIMQALVSMSPQRWMEMVREVFGAERADEVSYREVMNHIKVVNTCSDLRSPVEVWIDGEGWFRVSVYENREETLELG